MGNLQEGAEQTPRISLMVSELSGEAVGLCKRKRKMSLTLRTHYLASPVSSLQSPLARALKGDRESMGLLRFWSILLYSASVVGESHKLKSPIKRNYPFSAQTQ